MSQCPRCDQGWPVKRWYRYDGTGSWRTHQRGSFTFDNYEMHYCEKNGWVSRHRLLTFFILAYLVAACVTVFSLFCGQAMAHDHSNPAQNEWYQSLMQPDNPTMSCCGEADAYWADDVHFRGGKTFVTITDDRDDVLLKRPHIPNGTEIEVPNNKLRWDRSNPTGHGVVFVAPAPYYYVYCYVQGGGA